MKTRYIAHLMIPGTDPFPIASGDTVEETRERGMERGAEVVGAPFYLAIEEMTVVDHPEEVVSWDEFCKLLDENFQLFKAAVDRLPEPGSLDNLQNTPSTTRTQ